MESGATAGRPPTTVVILTAAKFRRNMSAVILTISGRTQKVDVEAEKDKTISRRSFVAALLGAALVIPAVTLAPSDAEAQESQERQFTSFRHKPRTTRPRSHTRGSRRHRRVARVRHTGRPQPRPDVPQQ